MLKAIFFKKSKNASEKFYKKFPNFISDFKLTKFVEETKKLIEDSKAIIDKIIKLKDDQMNYANTVEVLAYKQIELEFAKNLVELYCAVYTFASLLDVNKDITNFLNHIDWHEDLYNVFIKISSKKATLPFERDLYLNRVIFEQKRRGLGLPEDEKKQLKNIDNEIAELSNKFKNKVIEDDVNREFNWEKLDGLTTIFIKDLKKKGNQCIVDRNDRNRSEILKYCKVIESREEIKNCSCISGGTSNYTTFKTIINLRHQRAKILGYENHVEYISENLMSKNEKNIFDFLSNLATNLEESSLRERERLLYFKREECKERNIIFDETIHLYDLAYYQRIVEERDYSLDQNVIKQFFPINHVTQIILEMYQSLLHLRFNEITGTNTWHKTVKLYSVRDQNSDELIGYFFLDLFARPTKYDEIANFNIQSACKTSKGYQVSCAALLADFKQHTKTKPSLLTHEDIRMYLKKFCFLMHKIIFKAPYSIFQTKSVERDFIHASPLMVEKFAWEEDFIRKLSSNHKTGEKMSDDLIEKLCHSRKANFSMKFMFQIAFSVFDYKLHTSNTENVVELYAECMKKYTSIVPIPGTCSSAVLTHICRGFDAKYYSYLWSEVIACDMFLSKFKKDGVFSLDAGMSFRKDLLEPGSTKNADELLQKFLGRNYTLTPFLEFFGLQ